MRKSKNEKVNEGLPKKSKKSYKPQLGDEVVYKCSPGGIDKKGKIIADEDGLYIVEHETILRDASEPRFKEKWVSEKSDGPLKKYGGAKDHVRKDLILRKV